MPEAFPPGAFIGELGPKAAAECGLPVGLPLVAGLGDGQSACLGIGIVEPGESSLSLGTSIVSGTFSDRLRTGPAFRASYGGIPGSFILETVILGGAYTVNWLVDNFGGSGTAEAELEVRAQRLPPGAEGLMLVPYWSSAMNPYWDPDASGITLGWRGHHGRDHLYRAILEGTAYEQRLHTEGVERSLGRSVDRYVAVGGGSRSELWCRIIADVTGKPLCRLETPEAASLGAGILAAAAVGLFPDVPGAIRSMARRNPLVFEPDRERHEFYGRLYTEVYVHLFPDLRRRIDKLSELTALRAGESEKDGIGSDGEG
jgi:sugar (pentulose or hexulose) kinase